MADGELTSLRIAQLIDTLEPGGAERMAVNLANTFSARGIHHLLLVSRKLGALKDQISDPSVVSLLGKKKTIDLKAFRKLLVALDQFGVDILHVHGPSVYWGVAVKWYRPGIRLIWHDHLGISPTVIAENPRKEFRWISRWIDLVITANESTREFWLEKGFWTEDKVKYLPNYPGLTLLPAVRPPIFTFLHLANYRSEKGHLHLVHAARKLVDRGLNFKIRMVGKDVDPQWKKTIRESILVKGLTDTIAVEEESHDVSKLLSEVSAGLVVSDREGLPVALLEYGLGQLPVISSQVGQCPMVLQEGEFGLIFPTGNTDALADAMEKMILNPQEFAVLGRLYSQHILKNYGEKQFVGGYSKLLANT